MTLASILVVDPDATARTVIAHGLRELGHDVSETKDADSALEAVRLNRPDLLVCDSALPDLIALVDACLRKPANPSKSSIVSAGGISIDNVGHRVMVDGEYLSLAPREYRLLLFLLGNQDRVFSRKLLLVHVWDRDVTVGPRTVDVHIRRLRSLLEPFGYDKYIQTVRGSGYRFSLET